MPEISVIVPVYKVEKYLNRCVDSILAQTFADFELVLVDDGSPDQCAVICNKYAVEDDRVKVIHKSNGGLSSARNAGVDIAAGRYIVFVDSDDWVHCEMLESMMQLAMKYQADIVEMGFCRVYENQTEVINEVEESIAVLDGIKAAESLYEDTFYGINSAWGKMIKYKLFRDIRFPEGRVCEDSAILYRLLLQTEICVSSSKIMYYYYQTEESITRGTFNSKRFLDGIQAFEEISEYAHKHRLKRLYDLNQITLVGCLLKSYSKLLTNGFDDEAKQMLSKLRRISFLRNTEMRIKMKVYYLVIRVFPGLANKI